MNEQISQGLVKLGLGIYKIINDLSPREISLIINDEELSCVQSYKKLNFKTFELLNKELFSKRPEIELRMYSGFGDKDIFDLKFLELMPNLVKFSVDNVQNVKNIEYISRLTKLKSLKLGIYNLDSFEILECLPSSLEKIILEKTKSKKLDLKSLKNFVNLKSIYIESHTKNIEVLNELTNLEDVTLRSVSLDNLSCIRSLKNLKSLNIKLGHIKDFSAIEHFKNLEYIELWQIRGLFNLSFISQLTGLKKLFLQSLNNITRFPELNNLEKLNWILLDNMKNLNDFSSLEFAPALNEFTQYSANGKIINQYIPLLKNPSLRELLIGFGSDKRNREFEELAKKYGKHNQIKI